MNSSTAAPGTVQRFYVPSNANSRFVTANPTLSSSIGDVYEARIRHIIPTALHATGEGSIVEAEDDPLDGAGLPM